MACCFKCSDRVVGCHQDCKVYIAECEENAKKKQWNKENKVDVIYIGAFLGNAISHSGKSRHGRRK